MKVSKSIMKGFKYEEEEIFFCIRETKHLSTDGDISTDTIEGWTKNTPKPKFWKKEKILKTPKPKNV